ncbi:helix-turn-helix domain-containing protein [Streptomyces sp900105755]|uniref:PucR family transcriptional regulator n=1 Tax=unclassified Streptomyces TaxID=2593676 RepID=UPI00089A9AC4|nr:helix-turn-helix domain-containing protein [Streptomyces sp. Ag109_O5-10]SEE97253.1 PucR C-terminal helix-turn-helix domain-containing protein [Streptomyces sp. Ag109_O5-10]
MNVHRPAGAGGADGDLRGVLQRFDVGVVVRRMEDGFARLPAYTDFQWPVDRAAVVRWNVDLVLRWLVDGLPPDDYLRSELHEFLRARAMSGQPIEGSILVYRRGARMLWEALLDLASDADRAVLLARSETVWGCLEDYLDLVVEVFARAYSDQEDAPSTAGDRRARTLFDRLCARLPVTIEDQDRAARLGFDLVEPYRPFTAQLAGASVAAHADLAFRLRAAGALAFTEGLRVTGLTPSGFGWTAFLEDPRLLLAEDEPLARGRLGAAADGLRALIAIGARSGRRGRVRADDHLPELLLADAPDTADRVVRRVFGPLERADAVDLAATLRCLAAHGFDSTAAAAALPVHRNTLLYRVGRIEKLTGLSLREQRDRTLVLLAVTWETLGRDLRPAGAEPDGS